MHSPVWISYDPDFEIADYTSDWENSVDEYFDEGKAGGNKRKGSQKKGNQEHQKKRRKKLAPTHDIPELSLATTVREPVVWTTSRERLRSPELSTWKEGKVTKVALLEDWRDRFKISSKASTPKLASEGTEGISYQNGQVIDAMGNITTPDMEHDGTEVEGDETTEPQLPPTSLTQETDSLPKSQRSSSYLNGTASSVAKQAMRQASLTNINPPPPSKKRKASSSADEDDEYTAKEAPPERTAILAEVAVSAATPEHKANGSVNGKFRAKSKRKATESIEEESEPPPKKTVHTKKAKSAAAKGNEKTSTTRQTRSKRS